MTRRRKLLLADDSPTVQKVISLTFADEGLEVVTAADGRDALRLLEDEPPPDILLADAVMPGPDGYELCERVKRDERLRHIPVVLLVGTFEPFNEAEARRVGADTVLTKPFQSIRDLVSKVGSLLGGESKPEAEEHEPGAQAGHRELAEEVQARGRGAEAEPAPAPRASYAPAPTPAAPTPAAPAPDFPEARVAPETPAPATPAWDAPAPHADPAASFADLGADDGLIEARPADAFGGAAAAPTGRRDSFVEFDEPAAAPPSAPPPAASVEDPEPFDFAPEAGPAPSGAAAPARDAFNFAAADEGARPGFARRSAGLAAADDALLDLGQIEPPAAEAAAEADEFVLDLDDEFDAPPARAAGSPESHVSFDDLFDAPADAAGAFAEAAHGEPAPARTAPPAAAPPDFGEEAEAARTPFEFSALPSEAEALDPDVTREVVATDVPPFVGGFDADSGGASSPRMEAAAGFEGAGDAGRAGLKEFIEPRVVPAAEPTPGTFEDAFTDGSVEGDVPRPAPFATETPSAAPPDFAAPPSAAGYAMGETRAGVEEAARPAELSPEAVEAIARRVVELMSEKVVREIAWEVVPDLAELLIKRRLDEEEKRRG